MTYLKSMPDNDFRAIWGGVTLQTKRWVCKEIMQFWSAQYYRQGRKKDIVFKQTGADITLGKGIDFGILLLWATLQPCSISINQSFIEEASDYQMIEERITRCPSLFDSIHVSTKMESECHVTTETFSSN